MGPLCQLPVSTTDGLNADRQNGTVWPECRPESVTELPRLWATLGCGALFQWGSV